MSLSPLPQTDWTALPNAPLNRRKFVAALMTTSSFALSAGSLADEPAPKSQSQPKSKEPVPLNKEGTVLLDIDGKRLLLKTKVCLREGLLEMFLCRKQSKEHESILSVDSEAFVIHTGLLALGAKTGSPVKFQPEYSPPTGTRIRIFCQWTDADGKPHREPAEKWVRNSSRRFFVEVFDDKPAGLNLPEESELKWDDQNKELFWYGHMTVKQRDAFLALSADKKYRTAINKFYNLTQPHQLDAAWVFTGSGFYVDEQTKQKSYLAEGGDVICVANFPSAMIDLKARSSAQGESNLMWEAWKDRIPPQGTDVLLELVPEFEKPESKPEPAKKLSAPSK